MALHGEEGCRWYLRVNPQQSAEAKEGMTLLHIITYMAQGSAPRRDKVAQVWGNALGADPGDPAQGDGTADRLGKLRA